MSFSPALPVGGLVGWAFLNRTADAQKAAQAREPVMARDIAYFRENIANINTAQELVSDRRLLKVALGAFGLDSDLQNRAFIRKVLEDGTLSTKALANRLANKQYARLSAAFGFDLGTPRNKVSGFADRILASYRERQFEIAVGQSDNAMRLALNARRELGELSAKGLSDLTRWYQILGSPPLRTVFETALGLPKGFGSIDIDRQVGILKERAASVLGSDRSDQFTKAEAVESLVRRFLIRSEADSGAGLSSAPGAAALTILQQSSFRRL